MLRSRFVSVGVAVPERTVANAEIESELGVDAGWIESRTGVRERRFVERAAQLADLAESAARDALAAGQVAPAELDAIVVATSSAPYLFPSLACLVHARLGLTTQPAFDVAAACAGFPYALTVADQGIRSGDYRRVLVLGADCLSTVCDPLDRSTRPLFGDGAGAAVLTAERADESARGILASRLRALGSRWEILYVPAGARSPEERADPERDPWMRMQGQEVFRIAVEQLVALSREVLAAASLGPGDVKLLVPHQANARIVRMMIAQLGIAEDRVGMNIDRFGNTSAASIPIALHGALADRRLEDGDVLLLNAVGGGVTAGAVVARW